MSCYIVPLSCKGDSNDILTMPRVLHCRIQFISVDSRSVPFIHVGYLPERLHYPSNATLPSGFASSYCPGIRVLGVYALSLLP